MAPSRSRTPEPDFETTKVHIIVAGRELLLAAQGALAFCKHYVETNGRERRNPELIQFFTRALTVANDLGRDLTTAEGLKRVISMVIKPLETGMAWERKQTTKKRKQRGTS